LTTTVTIPGGTATLRDPGKLKVKHRRRMTVLTQEFGMARFMEIMTIGSAAQSINGGVLEMAEVMDSMHLTPRESELMQLMNEAAVWQLLDSWTLPDPLPATADDVGEMDQGVYDVLMAECGRLQAEHMAATGTGPDGQPADPFSVAMVEDLTSPTGASVASNGPSTGAGPRRVPSDRKKPSGGRRTATAPPSRD
jgi:hypothetical protein